MWLLAREHQGRSHVITRHYPLSSPSDGIHIFWQYIDNMTLSSRFHIGSKLEVTRWVLSCNYTRHHLLCQWQYLAIWNHKNWELRNGFAGEEGPWICEYWHQGCSPVIAPGTNFWNDLAAKLLHESRKGPSMDMWVLAPRTLSLNYQTPPSLFYISWY